MQFQKFVFCATSALICALTSACGGSSTPPAASPESVDQAATPESQETALKNPGHGVEVGMEFEDKGDDVAERRDRTPPPTQTYRPSNKTKQASAH